MATQELGTVTYFAESHCLRRRQRCRAVSDSPQFPPRFPRGLAAAALLAATLTVAPLSARADTTIFAAASTTLALTQIAAAYRERHGVKLTPVFAGSGALARQIDQGAPADLFLSANVKWMDWLEKRERLEPHSRVDLLGNCLVLIQPADADKALTLDKGLAAGLTGGRIAIGDPAYVPVGRYARAALKALDLWREVEPRAALMPSVRHILALVERGEVAAGFVYFSDTVGDKRVRIAARVDPSLHPPILYPLATVRAAARPEVQQLHEFLRSRAAQAIFARHGFRAVDGLCPG